MDKKTLSKMPREDATDSMIEQAVLNMNVGHIATASMADVMTIVITFYSCSDLRVEKRQPCLRTFMTREEYLTQDLTTEKTKWLTGSFEYMESLHFWKYYWNSETKESHVEPTIIMRSMKDRQLVEDFFADYKTDHDRIALWSPVLNCQKEIRDKRLIQKHRKVLDVIDERMAPVEAAPAEFFNWVWERGMSDSRYLIYADAGHGEAYCECTYCRKTGKISRASIRMRNNEPAECPWCSSPVICKAKGRMGGRVSDSRWFIYTDPTDDGFIWRFFRAVRYTHREPRLTGHVEQHIYEYCRAFYTFDHDEPHRTSYEWGVYKQRGECRWIPDEGKVGCAEAVLYPGNLPRAWEHTPMKYSAFEQIAETLPTKQVRYWDAVDAYREFPKLEWLCKMGLTNLAVHLLTRTGMVSKVNNDGKTIFNILGLDKPNTRTLQAVNGTDYHLRLLQTAQTIGTRMTGEQVTLFYDTFGCNTDLLKQTRRVTFERLMKYIDRESREYPLPKSKREFRWQEKIDPEKQRKQNMAADWKEYLMWCAELGHDTRDMFWYMPNHFKRVHDRTAEEYKAMMDKRAAAERRRAEALAKKMMEETKAAMSDLFKSNDGVDAFSIAGKGLVLVVPKTLDEIRAEGSTLHHCVATYCDRVAQGKTNIFFVRKAEAPEKPYFTMEYKDKVVQCRGDHNCGMPADVQAFVNVFEKKMQEAKDKNRELRRCS